MTWHLKNILFTNSLIQFLASFSQKMNFLIILFLFQVYRWVVSGEPLVSGASRRLGTARGQFWIFDQLYMTVVDLTSSQRCLFQACVSAPQGLLCDIIVCRIFNIASWNSDGLWSFPSCREMFKKPLVESFYLQKICECSLCHLLA